MDIFKRLFSYIAFATLISGLAVTASAQYSSRDNGYYGNRDISNTVKTMRDQARQFQRLLDSELDRSRYDGTRREDNLNSLAKRFKNAAEDLEDEYDGHRDRQKSADEAQRLLTAASVLDRSLSASRIGRNNRTLFSSWNAIEQNLSVIADYYNYGYNGGYGRGGRGDRDRGWGRGRNRNTNGRYGNIGSTIESLKYKARILEDKFDNRQYNRGNSNMENLTDRFKNAVDDLSDEYDSRDGGYNEAQKVLSIGEQVDREISRNRASRDIRSDWSSIERDLKTIAGAYNLRYNGNNGGLGGFGEIFRKWPF